MKKEKKKTYLGDEEREEGRGGSRCKVEGGGNGVTMRVLSSLCLSLFVSWGVVEIVTNGIYPSIEHRATVNSMKERLSIATFYSPKVDGKLGPAPSLITPETPALFKTISVADYFKGFFSRQLQGKSYLDVLKVQNENESG
ncbi:hypothetical protein Pint_10120 [Pistacia integerrima]|uniref:Uncharacterized protein n=1 Tax=Pistacia integerrima TaxID=434235 RepID=A0ACC0XHC7_9ROSI|nr:hypothetical protein Pint_10120 [Pistacia integerrima]